MDEVKIAKLLDEASIKSLKDAKFRKELLKDCNKAIKDEYNEELPIKVTMHESTNKKLVFILPEPRQAEEIDESDLATVSGGNMSSEIKIDPKAYQIPSNTMCAYAAYPRKDYDRLLESKAGKN